MFENPVVWRGGQNGQTAPGGSQEGVAKTTTKLEVIRRAWGIWRIL